MESELEEEKKQRVAAVNMKKKLEGDMKEMQSQVDMANKMKEDSMKQLRKLQVRILCCVINVAAALDCNLMLA